MKKEELKYLIRQILVAMALIALVTVVLWPGLGQVLIKGFIRWGVSEDNADTASLSICILTASNIVLLTWIFVDRITDFLNNQSHKNI